MAHSYDELKQISKSLRIPQTSMRKIKSKEQLQRNIDAVKTERPFRRFDPKYVGMYKTSDLVLFARDMGVSRYANGRAKTKAMLIRDLMTAKQPQKDRPDIMEYLCQNKQDRDLVRQLQQTRDQLEFVEAELQRLHSSYAQVRSEYAKKNAELKQLSQLLGEI